jgi:peptidoglycan/LPS O-acetylase OafA/YrhL
VATRTLRTMRSTDGRSTDGRSPGLDALRVLACLFVVVHHLGTTGTDLGILSGPASHGNTGVFLFFALSGYLLFKPFMRAAAGGAAVDLGSYAVKRAARILPGYYVALAALTFLTPGAESITHPLPFLTITSSYDIPLRDFLGVSWTLSAEIVFYLTLPVLARVSRGRELTVIPWLGIISFGGYFYYLSVLNGDNQWLVGSYPIVFYQFVPGMVAAILEVRYAERFAWLARWPVALVGGIFIVIGLLPNPVFVDFASSIGAGLAIPWLSRREWRFARTLAFLGGMSYAVYLWHLDLLQAYGAIALPFALLAAAASWAFVERPILEWAHRYSSRRKARHAASEKPAPTSAANPAVARPTPGLTES